MALPPRAFFTLHETASRWGCTIADIGGWATEGKLDIVTGFASYKAVPWVALQPNEHHDWINQRSGNFNELAGQVNPGR